MGPLRAADTESAILAPPHSCCSAGSSNVLSQGHPEHRMLERVERRDKHILNLPTAKAGGF